MQRGKAVFTGEATFEAGAANGAVQQLSVPVPADDADNSTYLVAVLCEAALGASVQVTLQNGLRFGRQWAGPRYATLQGANLPLVVAPDAFVGVVVQGWLVGSDPARATFTLQAAGSVTGGRCWLVVYAL